jgi:protein-tyrosine phosphatase
LVDSGCLLQITAGSLCGTFGPACRAMCERLLIDGLVHFVASDGHGPRSRRPLLRRAFERVAELAGEATAIDLCSHNPAAVAAGDQVLGGRRPVARAKRRWMAARSTA